MKPLLNESWPAVYRFFPCLKDTVTLGTVTRNGPRWSRIGFACSIAVIAFVMSRCSCCSF
jgi:hypothetical protein